MKGQASYETIDEYIRLQPKSVQTKLKELRRLIREIVPQAEERIVYRMPTFYIQGNLVHFAAHANHIGFYPTPSGIVNFKEELSGYETSKGAIQFPNDRALPTAVIRKIVKFRLAENLGKPKKGR